MIIRKEIRAEARGGFTLMEMLVVVAILVVLAGAAVPIYLNYLDQAKVNRAMLDCKTLTTVCETYKVKYGDFPQSLQQLVQPPDGAAPYIAPDNLLDPWGHPYNYDPTGQHNQGLNRPDIFSNGPRAGDPNAIIGNWTKGVAPSGGL